MRNDAFATSVISLEMTRFFCFFSYRLLSAYADKGACAGFQNRLTQAPFLKFRRLQRRAVRVGRLIIEKLYEVTIKRGVVRVTAFERDVT